MPARLTPFGSWKDDRFDCFISFPLKSDPLPVPDKSQALAGIGLNPNVVAVTVALPNGNFKVSRCFWSPDLVHASHEKREWIAGNLAGEVADWLASLGVRQVALEELSFAQDHDTNKVFNRITHNFTKKLLFTRLIVALRKRGIAVFPVPAAYTSLIGFFKYAETYGLNAHQAAALVIEALIQKLLGCPPAEGWTHGKLWGKHYGCLRRPERKLPVPSTSRVSWKPFSPNRVKIFPLGSLPLSACARRRKASEGRKTPGSGSATANPTGFRRVFSARGCRAGQTAAEPGRGSSTRPPTA
ncbi:MAG: Mobile element protein [Hydrogenibacillus schlegelii]|uniref:Mobile element protein n=1 Tax=Hydrogenibacillus schlegelii TaxID=1484 RepID=A0A2T5G3L3_HYDSH|nr:hypothetical protein [Hydrogenibacillus schlegelii]PTQ50742.1 MAG: Mobile element protein [Hydrogenibacillus schlegelii]